MAAIAMQTESSNCDQHDLQCTTLLDEQYIKRIVQKKKVEILSQIPRLAARNLEDNVYPSSNIPSGKRRSRGNTSGNSLFLLH